jgi:hypothetical protein
MARDIEKDWDKKRYINGYRACKESSQAFQRVQQSPLLRCGVSKAQALTPRPLQTDRL